MAKTLKTCVLQEWVQALSWKKQTVLMECIRAPDVPASKELRMIFRYFRSVILKDADPTSDFMKGAFLPQYDVIMREFERLPLHCAHHVLMALEVIGYDHPDENKQSECWMFYCDAVKEQHFEIEGRVKYNSRMESKEKVE